jgi:hypothetical protein
MYVVFIKIIYSFFIENMMLQKHSSFPFYV